MRNCYYQRPRLVSNRIPKQIYIEHRKIHWLTRGCSFTIPSLRSREFRSIFKHYSYRAYILLSGWCAHRITLGPASPPYFHRKCVASVMSGQRRSNSSWFVTRLLLSKKKRRRNNKNHCGYTKIVVNGYTKIAAAAQKIERPNHNNCHDHTKIETVLLGTKPGGEKKRETA